MAVQTLEIDLNFFLTEKGKEFKIAYKDWKNRAQEEGTLAALREELAQDGLIKKGITGKISNRIWTVFKKQDALTLDEITKAVNDLLEKEGKGEQATSREVKASLSFSCCDVYESVTKNGKKVKTSNLKRKGWLEFEDDTYTKRDNADAIYNKTGADAEEEEQTTELVETVSGKKKKTAGASA